MFAAAALGSKHFKTVWDSFRDTRKEMLGKSPGATMKQRYFSNFACAENNLGRSVRLAGGKDREDNLFD
jgi:hypothetical protein